MFKKYSFWGIFLKILLVVLLVAGGIALYRFGYAHGYVTGAAVEVGEGMTWPEVLHPRFMPGVAVEVGEGSITWPGGLSPRFMPYHMHPRGFFPGRIAGLFFGGLLFFMGIAAIRRLIWFQRWQAADGPEGEAWMGGWHACAHPHHWGPAPWMRPPVPSQEEPSQPED